MWNVVLFVLLHILLLKQSSKWKLEFTGPNQILEFIFYIVLNKKIDLSEQLIFVQRTGVQHQDYWYHRL